MADKVAALKAARKAMMSAIKGTFKRSSDTPNSGERA